MRSLRGGGAVWNWQRPEFLYGRFLVTLNKRKIGHCQSAKVNVHGGVCVRTPIARSGGPLGWWGPGANRSRSPGAAARLRHLLVLDTRSSHARSLTAVAASAHTSHHSSTRLTDRYCIFSCLIFIFNIQFNLDIMDLWIILTVFSCSNCIQAQVECIPTRVVVNNKIHCDWHTSILVPKILYYF